MTKGLYWFTNDLRLEDNSALNSLLSRCETVMFLYVVDPRWFAPNNFHHKQVGEHRWLFIKQSIVVLNQQLQRYGHSLHIAEGRPEKIIADIIVDNAINVVGSAQQVGFYEDKQWQNIQQKVSIDNICEFNSTLYQPSQIDTTAHGLRSFSAFRKKVESSDITPNEPIELIPLSDHQAIKPSSRAFISLSSLATYQSTFTDIDGSQNNKSTQSDGIEQPFQGGEIAAIGHVIEYFSTDSALSYKQTRNALDGWLQSTKFSPYLAAGNISPRQLWQILKSYEAKWQKNESTYWIGFELLWREYFQWVALLRKAKLFSFQGNSDKKPLTSFYSQRFALWCQGSTAFPIVNACMHQLNATGYMSNRGRQIVASCLVNELSVDWRYGAAYFQQQLIDHDVASNWGNWQYIAGVGVDPRGGRHFNLNKQTATYDPDAAFINKWQGKHQTQLTDGVDAADWPLSVEQCKSNVQQTGND